MSQRIENFAARWVLTNVHQIPGLKDLPYEVDRLSAKITADARMDGISGSELDRSIGDIDVFLTIAYEEAVRRPTPSM